ncbi:MAG: tetratricopeptide repeat protein [Gammaproteobacteria bacterium]|jgi:tetratricopeptide (TPR) repeat protein|nr:tetratricopeptide repeat protein [Gammaproteobacteria bacterium]MBT5155497.1 tetratricopeptide repeat protein [Gammaproteobacteria bacterium]MBT5724935.1 tetratricopeptide repeat protein [Gammaproteobacteria bacterium]MBT6586932.1 tetratricopeptide repeat protein [Gammaproteobacteria bacterium]
MRWIIYLIIISGTQLAHATSKTTFGSDNATRCYQESNTPFSTHGLMYCSDAISKDGLLLRDLAATHTNRGIIYAANGQLDRAMKDHNKAASLAPEMGKIYINRGNVYHQTKNYVTALADYDKALELANVPLDIVHYNRSLALIRLKRWDDALDALQAALAINPESGRVKRKLDQLNAQKEKLSTTAVKPGDNLNQ